MNIIYICSLFLIQFSLLSTGVDCSNVINKNVQRIIDITSQLVKINTKITLENIGNAQVTNYIVEVEPKSVPNLAYISAKSSQNDQLSVQQAKDSKNRYVIQLAQSLNKNTQAQIIVDTVFTKSLIPHPAQIKQMDKQFVRYFGMSHFYSPLYPTEKQITKILLPSKNIESYSRVHPVTQSENSITYGPYSNITGAAQEPQEIVVHYENYAPFLTVTDLVRTVEISHWGSVSVVEQIQILHTGAVLMGSFSRYDYQRDTNSGLHSIKSYKTILPAAAHSIYYRDMNGNISTSQVRQKKDWTEVELRPRFPLFGGWRSAYTLGYSVPSYQYLFREGAAASTKPRFTFKFRLLDHIFKDMHVEQFEVAVVLPVGVTNVKVTVPDIVNRTEDTVTYKYMDNLGRIVVHVKGENFVEQHIAEDMEISYELNPLIMLHKPILLSVAFYMLFILAIIYVRLDFSLNIPEHDKKD